ncbi:MAG: ISAzo13 family transposase [Zavarzinella sp.]|nr:ISAzo13 family transposase [Zavarzinella sp.]
MLRKLHFSLRTCRKQRAGMHDPDRDRQFRYLVRLRKWYLARNWPVISADTKKKEWVGEFKNPGRAWRRASPEVLDHDFPKWAEGRAIPMGVYDVGHNDGYVVVGTSHETPTFAVRAIRRWWRDVGRPRYPGVRHLLIEADSGGANDHRKWEWKVALQDLADESGLTVTVTHYPPGASKWNPIDHRMFSLISANWAGEPLRSYETILKHIRATRSEAGFHCRAVLDHRTYESQPRARAWQKRFVHLKPRKVPPQWNYTISPHSHRQTADVNFGQ